MTLPDHPQRPRPARPRSSRSVLVPRPLPYKGTRTSRDLVPVVPDEDEQLELFDPYDDGLSFGEWMETLPKDGQG